MPDRLPTSMFCGLPVIVATLPMLDPMATASSNGSGDSPRSAATSSTMGVNIRHTVSLTNIADSTPAATVMATTSARGLLDVSGDQPRGRAEERRHLQMGDEHHHPEQQDERPVVDGARGLLEPQAADGDHQDRADDGGAGAVDAEDRHAAQREDRVGAEKDEGW